MNDDSALHQDHQTYRSRRFSRGSIPLSGFRVATTAVRTMHDSKEFELTVRETVSRDLDTDEEVEEWRVESEKVNRPCVGDTPAEALRVFANCLETDNEEVRIEVDELAAD